MLTEYVNTTGPEKFHGYIKVQWKGKYVILRCKLGQEAPPEEDGVAIVGLVQTLVKEKGNIEQMVRNLEEHVISKSKTRPEDPQGVRSLYRIYHQGSKAEAVFYEDGAVYYDKEDFEGKVDRKAQAKVEGWLEWVYTINLDMKSLDVRRRFRDVFRSTHWKRDILGDVYVWAESFNNVTKEWMNFIEQDIKGERAQLNPWRELAVGDTYYSFVMGEFLRALRFAVNGSVGAYGILKDVLEKGRVAPGEAEDVLGRVKTALTLVGVNLEEVNVALKKVEDPGASSLVGDIERRLGDLGDRGLPSVEAIQKLDEMHRKLLEPTFCEGRYRRFPNTRNRLCMSRFLHQIRHHT